MFAESFDTPSPIGAEVSVESIELPDNQGVAVSQRLQT